MVPIATSLTTGVITMLYIICLLSFIYGFGVVRFIVWTISYLRDRLPPKDLVKSTTAVLSWTVGGGLFYAPLKAIKLSDATGILEADAVAALCYLGGLGAGLVFIDIWIRKDILSEMSAFLSDDELNAILLVSRIGINPDVAAKNLKMNYSEFEEVFMSALTKIERRGKRFLALIGNSSVNKN